AIPDCEQRLALTLLSPNRKLGVGFFIDHPTRDDLEIVIIMSASESGSPPASMPSTPPSNTTGPNGFLPPLGIATLSLGSYSAGHFLPEKLQAAAQSGFNSVELFDNDWYTFRDDFAAQHGFPLPAKEGDAASRAAAQALRAIAKAAGVDFSCFQPLRAFEGFLSEEDRQAAREHARGVLDILSLLETELLLVCSSTTPASQTTGDVDVIAADLSWLADLAASYSPPIRIMYEGLSFGTHRRRWQDAWEVIEKVNRPNLGLCLDSFNTLALEWADPYKHTGRLSDHVDAELDKNLAELVRRVPGDRIFFYQVADGKFMSPPLHPPTDPEVPRLRPWSRSSRLFPLEKSRGAYLPVDRFSDAVIRTGYKGPWSVEVFNDSLSERGEAVPREHATRAFEALRSAAIEAFVRADKA
ncbi:sugar phosphate isomerase/epimerase family protein, partial [Sporobolomyces koalae]|uniref:sugar phosphate isomerase/epimerase family protein n=1 Tax=Sporobolomyces koalae TaxID=500713 RepID=UPI00316DC9DC